MNRVLLPATLLLSLALVIPAELSPSQSHIPASLASASSADRESGVDILGKNANLDVRAVSLEQALLGLQHSAGLRLAYSPSLLPSDHYVTCRCSNLSVHDAMERLLAGTHLEVFVGGEHLVIRERSSTDLSRSQILSAAGRLHPSNPLNGNGHRLHVSPRRSMGSQVGAVSGQVLDAATRQPISTVQVSIPGTGLGTFTGQDGRYRLEGIPAGSHTLEVSRIGYRSIAREIAIVSGETIAEDFDLTQQALGLDAIVVTGTAGQARQREVGVSVARLNIEDAIEPFRSVESMLQAQAPGVSVVGTGASVGAGSMIRLRGVSSLSMGNQPLIYIDGVRIRSDGAPRNNPPVGFDGRGSDAFVTPLNEMNPDDIERIEIIKGPAATTLYGTEAAAGVIQIFTKRGAEGAARWTLQVDQGLNSSRRYGTPNEPYFRMEPVLRTGWNQSYSASVAGGVEAVQYYLSARLDSEEGILKRDSRDAVSLRGNLEARPRSNLTLSWNSSYSRTEISHTSSGNNSNGVVAIPLRMQNSALGSRWQEDLLRILEWDILNDHSNFTTGLTMTFLPVDFFSNRLTVGFNRFDAGMRNIRNFGFVLAPQGILSTQVFTSENLTVDYVANVTWQAADNLRTTFSFGGQWSAEDESHAQAYGEGLPGPSVPTVSSAALRSGFESRQRVVTGGVFGQSQFAFRDRYYLTLGLRLDGNSAFGSDLGFQAYPKIDGSWVVSDEDFWSENWGTLRLRGAYGQAGRAPGAFDAVRTWNPGGFAGFSTFLPGNVGNSELGPERSSEVETGFDLSILDDRLSTTVTYYRQRVTDALFPVTQIPSKGFQGSQLENVGEMENKGLEVSVTGELIASRDWGWTMNVGLSTNNNKVIDLGGAAPFSVSGGFVREGAPAPLRVSAKLLNPNEFADPVVELNHEFGPSTPTRTINLGTTVRMRGGVTLSARGEYQGGHYMFLSGARNTITRSTWPWCSETGSDGYNLIREGRVETLTAQERYMCSVRVAAGFPTVRGDFFRLRELSLRAPVQRFVPGTTNASLTLALRNWFDWLNSDWRLTGFDPEITGRGGLQAPAAGYPEAIPGPRTFTASLRVNF